MRLAFIIGAALALALALPASAQSVRAGIEAWQKGDHAAAIAAWTPLAAKGDADAAFNLGQAHRLGKGVPIDLARAQRFFEQAARKGHADAAATLGILLFQNGDRPGAIRWLKMSAEAGEARAMLLYGTALFNGDGVVPDPVTAYAYISRSAAQGLDMAKATLADLDAVMPLGQRKRGLAMARAMVGPEADSPAGKSRPAARIAARAPLPPPSASPANRDGAWRIQLGAFAYRASAEALFARLRGKLGGGEAYYVPAGKVVRLQVGPYPSRAAASAACTGLGDQACFPVAR